MPRADQLMLDEQILTSDQVESSSRSLRFIADYLKRGSNQKLTGLLLARLDAFNRIGATFGNQRSSEFCNEYKQQLRGMLPPNTPIIRLSDRRFAILLSLDSMTTIIDIAARLAEEQPPQFKHGDDMLFVDLTLGVAMHPTHADSAESLFRAMRAASLPPARASTAAPTCSPIAPAVWARTAGGDVPSKRPSSSAPSASCGSRIMAATWFPTSSGVRCRPWACRSG
jgi:GGDEF domain-containing protein